MIVKYKTFKIPKRKGGFRVIEQPIDEGLEYLQTKLRELEKVPEFKPSYFSHAFMRGRNIVTCAKQHEGQKFIARVDVTDFFTSITLDKFIKYIQLNFKETSTDRKRELINMIIPCFKYDEKSEKHTYLPQGAPTSPFLSNVYMRFFDWKVAWYCAKKEIVYNRYADDMFFSSNERKPLHGAMNVAKNYLEKIELTEKTEKRKVMKQGQQMNVVGIVLNEKFQIPKRTRKIIRAMKHNAKKFDMELTHEQKGLINFEHMVKKYDNFVKNNIEICGMIHAAYQV